MGWGAATDLVEDMIDPNFRTEISDPNSNPSNANAYLTQILIGGHVTFYINGTGHGPHGRGIQGNDGCLISQQALSPGSSYFNLIQNLKPR